MNAQHRIACVEAIRAIAITAENSYVDVMPAAELEKTQRLAERLCADVDGSSTLVALVAALALARTLAEKACHECAALVGPRSNDDAPDDATAGEREEFEYTDEEEYALSCAATELLFVLGEMTAPEDDEQMLDFDRGCEEISDVLRRRAIAMKPIAVDICGTVLAEIIRRQQPDETPVTDPN